VVHREYVEASISRGRRTCACRPGHPAERHGGDRGVAADHRHHDPTEAALSFLGVGVQPPNTSWGTIINDGLTLLYTRPWVTLAPGIMIVLTVLALNVLGDGVRDALDPRAKLRVKG
jgi:hypothetical protein